MDRKVTYDRIEEFEIAPGLVMTIRVEDNSLPEVVERFLRRKSTSGELRKILKGGRYYVERGRSNNEVSG